MDQNTVKEITVRERIIEAIKKDLLGPSSEKEVIYDRPNIQYLTGILTPLLKQENISNDYLLVDKADTSNNEEEISEEDEGEVSKSPLIKSSSIGLSFYVSKSVNKIKVNVSWGEYIEKKEEIIPENFIETEDDSKNDKKDKVSYHRIPHNDLIEIDLSKKDLYEYPCDSDNEIVISYIKYKLKNEYSLISVYLWNKKISNNEIDSSIFQANIKVSCEEGFVAEHNARNNNFNDEYFYIEKPIYARGRGCAAVWDESKNPCVEIETDFIPAQEICAVSADFNEFKNKPDFFSTLKFSYMKRKKENIDDLKLFMSNYQSWIDSLKDNNKKSMFQGKMENFNQIINKCQNAHDRILDGIDILNEDDMSYKAFCVMNQTIYLQNALKKWSKKREQGIECDLSLFTNPKDSKNSFNWRPFQLAFILLNIKSIIKPNDDERKIVDLLFFPTGGGKTEAYLGLMSFTIFNRRLRKNKYSQYNGDGGVTIILRYTLRLLTTQQRDRLTKMIIAAEYIRSHNPNLYGNERISIGFWVGDGVISNSFNDFCSSKQEDELKAKRNRNSAVKQLTTCPYCGSKLEYKDDGPENENAYSFDIEKQELKIYCLNKKCEYAKYPESGETPKSLPIYLIDEEIYNKCPTIILGTVDKFAKLPWDVRTNNLFGRVSRKCPRHGFVAIGDHHPVKHREKENLQSCESFEVKPFLPPELIVQDELHLITGPLGTIYGGYETLIERLCSYEINGVMIKPKYIVSTATIKNAGEQIKSLYGRNYFQFPPAGLDSTNSYFTREIPLSEKPFRKYIGICANGQSMKTTLLRIFAATLQEVKNISNEDEYKDYIDPYYTLIGYFNSIRELGGAARLIDDDIPKRIKRICKMNNIMDRRVKLNHKEITSRINSDEIKKQLDLLEINYTDKNCTDIVIATNMIAVGMDVDRLGLMSVLGQPKQNSEYIQATSRIGRAHLGLVLTIYNPYRPRDLSHYENFKSYHSQLYRYVEGTTATPFAARARDRFLHAIIVATIRLYYPELAAREDAQNINCLSQNDIDKITNLIIEKVNIIDPQAITDTKKEIKYFIDEWKHRVDNTKVVYSGKYSEDQSRIMVPYAEDHHDEEKGTLQSMREVDKNSGLFIYEEEV